MDFVAGRIEGLWSWRASQGDVEVSFTGKGPRRDRVEALRRVLPEGVEGAWLEQVHSADVLTARPGDNGPGDALVTVERDRALAVVTADCVPLLLAGGHRIAAIHAGWRGIAKSIVPAALARLDAAGGPGRARPGRARPVTAWIGPAIGPCCYEVGHDVAQEVIAATSEEIVAGGGRGRPRLDLVAAVRIQLRRGGVTDVRVVESCTRCDERRLSSYRRDGAGAGRNVAVIWRHRGLPRREPLKG